MQAKRVLICAAAMAVLASGAAWSESGQPAGAGRPRLKDREGKNFAMARYEQLNLTADQSQQIASILKLNKEASKAAATKAREAREARARQIQSGPFDEQSVRAACKQAAAAEEEACVLRAKTAGQIRAVLTAEQQAALDKIVAEQRNRLRRRIGQGTNTTAKLPG